MLFHFVGYLDIRFSIGFFLPNFWLWKTFSELKILKIHFHESRTAKARLFSILLRLFCFNWRWIRFISLVILWVVSLLESYWQYDIDQYKFFKIHWQIGAVRSYLVWIFYCFALSIKLPLTSKKQAQRIHFFWFE